MKLPYSNFCGNCGPFLSSATSVMTTDTPISICCKCKQTEIESFEFTSFFWTELFSSQSNCHCKQIKFLFSQITAFPSHL